MDNQKARKLLRGFILVCTAIAAFEGLTLLAIVLFVVLIFAFLFPPVMDRLMDRAFGRIAAF